jgi:hypothetical protein
VEVGNVRYWYFDVSWISIFHHDQHCVLKRHFTVIKNVNRLSLLPSILSGHGRKHSSIPKRVGKQSSYLFTNKIVRECKAWKLFTYHGLSPSLCNHMGMPSVARLQRQELSWTKQEDGDLVGFLQASIHMGHASSVEFCKDFDLATLQLCSQIYWNSFFRNTILFTMVLK